MIEDKDHGQRSTYVNMKCRCPACKEANRIYMRPYMQDWKQGLRRGFPQKSSRKKKEDSK